MLKVMLDRQLGLRFVRLFYLRGGNGLGCWKGPHACPLWGPLLSRKQLYSDKQLGFPAWEPGSLPRTISQLKASRKKTPISLQSEATWPAGEFPTPLGHPASIFHVLRKPQGHLAWMEGQPGRPFCFKPRPPVEPRVSWGNSFL